MALVVNKAGYNLSLKDERDNNILIAANNKAYNVSDFVYFRYKELLHLIVPKNNNVITSNIQNININKIEDIQQNIQYPSFDKIEEINIDIEPKTVKEKIKPLKPLKGVKISKSKRIKLTKTKKEVINDENIVTT
jgi:hypothetical protein